jgi:putative DNA primase/helicase
MIQNNLIKFENLFKIKLTKNKKTPAQKEWNDKKKQYTTIDNNKYNIGIPTGNNNNIIALDIDEKDEGIIEFQKYINKYGEPNTVKQLTPNNGFHLIFLNTHSDKIYNDLLKTELTTKTKYRNKGLDIRNEGGYICSFPSIIDNNKKYEYIRDFDNYNILEMPKTLIDWLLEKENIKEKKEEEEDEDEEEEVIIKEIPKNNIKLNEGKTKKDFIKNLLEILNINRADNFENWRNIGFIIKYEIDNFKLFNNFSKKSNKYNKDEVLKFWNSINNNNNNLLKIKTLIKYCIEDNKYEYILLKNEYVEDNFNFNDITTSNIGEHFKKTFGHKFLYQNDKLYYYNDVYWKVDDKNKTILNNFISKEYYNYIFELYKKFEDNELNKIKNKSDDKTYEIKMEQLNKIRTSITQFKNYDKRQQFIKDIICKITDNEIKFDENPYLFAFNNKIFDLKQNKFIESSPTQYISLTTNYDFIEQNETENIKELNKLLNSIFPQEDLKKLYLTILATGLDGINLEKFVISNGSGGNGKGLLNEFCMHMLGDYAYVLPVNILLGPLKTGSNPEIANMNNKRMVISREPDRDLKFNCSTIKEITGGDQLNARLNHSNDTRVNLKLTFILECNDKPKLNETNDALARRILDIPFKNKFVDSNVYDELNEEEKKTTFLINHYYKTQEFKDKYKYAFFLILANHYKEFYKNNRILPITNEIKQRNNQYLANSDELLGWFENKYEKTKDIKYKLKLKEIYNEYTQSDYFNNLNKQQKRNNNYKNFIQQIGSNMFLKKFLIQEKETYFIKGYIKIEEEINGDDDDKYNDI